MIKDFIVQNWYYLALLFIALCNMIILLCKRSKVVQKDTIFTQLLLRLPEIIRKVERPDLTGADKKCVVINWAIEWLCDMTGLDNAECRDAYYSRVSDAIEAILSTPEKKGDK